MYILNIQEQQRVLETLNFVENRDEGWTRLYLDNEGNKWTLYHPFSAAHGGGPPYLRKGDLPENEADLPASVIHLLRSGTKENALGIATDLLDQHENWSLVFDLLEASYADLDPQTVSDFVEALGIMNPRNRRSILGKTFDEIKKDVAYFKALSLRARHLHNGE